MKSNSTFLLQLYVKKCKINLKEAGSVGLLLRAGKSQSHITDMKPIIKGIINFNTYIKLNIDQSALDTQRCSLTLNFVSAENTRRVIGIVVINLPPLDEEIDKTFKITSTPDKQAEIQLSICVNELDENMRVKQKPKTLQKLRESYQKETVTQKYKSMGEQLLIMTSKGEEKPTSPPSQINEKLNLKSKRSQIESLGSSEELLTIIQKLQREKELLKQLLKIQMARSFKAQTHLKNIVDCLQLAIGVNISNLTQDTHIRYTLPGQSSLIKKASSLDINKGNFSLSTPGLGNNSILGIVKQSKFQNSLNHPSDSKIKSHISFNSEKSIDLMSVLTSLKKKMEDNGLSKSEIRKLFEKIKNEPQIDFDPNKTRTLKTRIDRSYLELMGKQRITKDQILKHKIDVNKILDEVINPILAKLK